MNGFCTWAIVLERGAYINSKLTTFTISVVVVVMCLPAERFSIECPQYAE